MSNLTECIRKGITIAPEQSFGHWYSSINGNLSACILGAALLGSDQRPILCTYDPQLYLVPSDESDKSSWFLTAYRIFPEIRERSICPVCPVCANDITVYGGNLGGILIHLNDHHRWSREDIAQWLESLEPSEEAVTEAEMVCA